MLGKGLGRLLCFGIFLPVLGSLFSIYFLHDWYFNHHSLHAIVEIAGSAIAISLSFFLLSDPNIKKNFGKNEIIWIRSAILGMGVLDGFHALSLVGNNFVWLHSIATFVGGVLFSAVWLSNKKFHLSHKLPFMIFLASISLGIFSFVFPDLMPRMLEQGQFNLFAKFLNIAGGFGFILATIYFYLKYYKSLENNYYLLSAHCLLFGFAGILFELSSLWDAAWWWWHLLRLGAYFILIFFFIENIAKKNVQTISFSFRKDYLINFLTFIVGTTAVVVIYGWYVGNLTLIQINPAFAPMQYNTALCFLLTSIALSTTKIWRFPIRKLCGVVVFLIGFLTILEYILNVNFGIDEFFVEANIVTKVSHAGRMAPNTALCFVISGLAVILVKNKTALLSLSGAIFTLSVIALIGYIFNVEGLYGIGNLTRMAIHTAFGFLLLSAAFFILFKKDKKTNFDIWSISPIVAAVVLLFLTILSWQISREIVYQSNKVHFENIAKEKINIVKKNFVLYRHTLLGSIGLIKASENVTSDEWKNYTKSIDLYNNIKGVSSVGIIDYVQKEDLDSYLQKIRSNGIADFKNHPHTQYGDKYIIRYIEPLKDNQQLLGLDIAFQKEHLEDIKKARDSGYAVLTKAMYLGLDNKKISDFLLLSPIYKSEITKLKTIQERQESFLGVVYSSFLSHKFIFNNQNNENIRQIEFTLYDSENLSPKNLIYKTAGSRKYHKRLSELKIIKKISVGQRVWTFVFCPSKNFLPKYQGASEVVLAIGLILTILFSWTFYLLGRLYGNSSKNLEINRKMLKSVVDNSMDGIITIDSVGNIITFNFAAQKIFGYKIREVMGENINILLEDESANNYKEYIKNHKTSKEHIGYERELIGKRKNGETFIINISTSKIIFNNEQGFSATIRDINDKRLAEIELKESKEKISTIFSNIVDGIITIDEDGSIDSFNPACENIFGYKSSEIIGKNINKLLSSPYKKIENIVGIDKEVKGKRKNKEIFVMETSFNKITLGDHHLFCGIIKDITKRKQMEEMKDNFISTVNHELRTPLTSIRGSLDLLKIKTSSSLDEKSQRLLDICCDNSVHLSCLINDILDVEKIVSGNMSYNKEVTEMCALIKSIVEGNKGFSSKYNVTLKDVYKAKEAYCNIDKGRFKQVLDNIISNAVKFSFAGQEVVISVFLEKKTTLMVSVADKGCGISESFKDKIFDKFSQEDSSSTRKKGGTGLGLSIVQAIMKDLKGKVSFESKEGKGTTFYLSLPIKKIEKKKTTKKPAKKRVSKTKKKE